MHRFFKNIDFFIDVFISILILYCLFYFANMPALEYNLFCILARLQQLYSGKSQNINQVQILRFPVPLQFLGSSVCGTVLGNN